MVTLILPNIDQAIDLRKRLEKLNIVWQKYWRLLVLSKSGTSTYTAVCDCWQIKEYNKYMLINWRTKSCWCLREEMARNRINSYIEEKKEKESILYWFSLFDKVALFFTIIFAFYILIQIYYGNF